MSKTVTEKGIILPSDLPDIGTAKLPQRYERAKQSLAACVEIDECAKWAKKADAMASYAKQAADESLFKMATRIKARAIQRCGELLRALTPERNKAGRIAGNSKGGLTISRAKIAKEHGLSQHQKNVALRVANVPKAEFESAIEAANPASVKELAARGTKRQLIDLQGRDPKDFARANEAWAAIEAVAELAGKIDPKIVLRGTLTHEYKHFDAAAAKALEWIGEIVKGITPEWRSHESDRYPAGNRKHRAGARRSGTGHVSRVGRRGGSRKASRHRRD